MKSLLLLISFCGLTVITYSQSKWRPIISSSASIQIEPEWSIFNLWDLHSGLGVKHFQKNGDFDLMFNYQYSESIPALVLINKKNILKQHLFGLTMNYNFLNYKKRIRPFIQFGVLTEISSNYRNKYIDIERYYPIDKPFIVGTSDKHGNQTSVTYSSQFYYSTPLFAHFSVGCNLLIVKDLYLTMSFGYVLKYQKMKFFKWDPYTVENVDDVKAEVENIKPNMHHIYHMINVQLGLNYTIPFKKKEKVKPIE